MEQINELITVRTIDAEKQKNKQIKHQKDVLEEFPDSKHHCKPQTINRFILKGSAHRLANPALKKTR